MPESGSLTSSPTRIAKIQDHREELSRPRGAISRSQWLNNAGKLRTLCPVRENMEYSKVGYRSITV